jgi:perosamine synthetase
MLPPHPTLRLRDVLPRQAHSLRKTNLPHALHLTYNARGALYQLLRSLPAQRGRTVLLPAFHCTAMVEPVVRAGFAVKFYRVRPDFSADIEDISRKMSSDAAALVVIHYFGFPTEMQPFLDIASRYDCYVVEDCAHSFLSRQGGNYVGHRGDFALYSYYKFAPSLSGGGLGINLGSFGTDFSSGALPLRERMVLAKRLFEGIVENAKDHPVSRILLALERKRVQRKQSEEKDTIQTQAPRFVDDPYLFREDLALAGMPRLCRWVLESCNWEEIMSLRQRNYRLFSRLLGDTSILRRVCPELPDNVCPWAFPVFLEDRPLHEQKLRGMNVPLFTFGEILHPLLESFEDDSRRDAEYISRRLMLLPVHPQIGEEDVHAFADVLNRFATELENKSGVSIPGEGLRDQGVEEVREGQAP